MDFLVFFFHPIHSKAHKKLYCTDLMATYHQTHHPHVICISSVNFVAPILCDSQLLESFHLFCKSFHKTRLIHFPSI